MAGTGSSANPAYIKNCVVEEGVIIGYDKKTGGLGSFSGHLVGTIENCRQRCDDLRQRLHRRHRR
ncbi:MAG: hypothetical protein V8S89_04735 [Oscillospiraceae bacterium]